MATLRRIWRSFAYRLAIVVRAVIQDEWVVYRHAAPNRIVEISAVERGPLLALLALVGLSILVPSRVWAVLLAGLGAALAFAFTWALSTGLRMRFTRQTVYAWVQVGDRLEEDFALENNAPFPVLAAEIDDHWPLTMRHESLLIKEFDREMGGHIWLALDLHHAVHAGEGEHSTLEYGVIWAASWAWHLLRAGKSVGLYCYGPSRLIVPPRDGNQHLWQLLRTLWGFRLAGAGWVPGSSTRSHRGRIRAIG